MKFSPAALLLATASAITLPVQDSPTGTEQNPSDSISVSWGRDGSSNSWQGFPSPVASSAYGSPWSQYPPPNPYQSNPYSPNSYAPNPYSQPNSYSPPPSYAPPPSPYTQPNPYVPPVAAPGPDPYSPDYNVPADANAPYVPASPDQAPTQVTIEKTGYSGNGCPSGTVSTLLSPDKTVVTFGFDVFQAVIGPNANAADKQKNCQLHLGLRYPGGYQMSIMQATYHGYVRLDPSVTANFISSYYFSQAAEKTAMTRTTLSGPEYQNGKTYTKQDSIQNESMIWSPCGANGILNINNRIALTAGNRQASGEISNDDATIKFEQKLKIQWRKCGGSRRLDVDTSAMPENNEQVVTNSNVIVN